MSDLFGVCGLPADIVSAALQRARSHIERTGSALCDRYQAPGWGMLRFHHGVLSPSPQPATSAEGGLAVAVDGDVTNQRELAARLARKGTALQNGRDAAEIVLRMFAEEGDGAFRRMNGSFAAAVYERAPGRLTLATDRFVSRPLFYAETAGGLVFGTRFNALLNCGLLQGRGLDVAALMQLLTFQQCQLELTLVAQVRALPPGALLTWADGRVRVRRYWRARYSPRRMSRAECAEAVTEALNAAAGRHEEPAAARCAVMLSGGLDSRITAAMLPGLSAAFTAGDWVNPEVRTARRVSAALALPHLFLRRRPDHYARLLQEAVELTGGMCRYDHCHFLGHLGAVRERCEAAYVEEPMDVLFKGYYWRRRPVLLGLRVPVPAMARLERGRLEEQLLRLDAKSTFPSRPWLLLREPWRSRYHDIMLQVVRRQIADADTEDPYNVAEHVAGRASYGRTSSFANLSCLRPHLPSRALSLDNGLLALSHRIPVKRRCDDSLVIEVLRRVNPRLAAIPCAATGVPLRVPGPLAWSAQVAAELGLRLRKHAGLVAPHLSNESWPERGELLRISPLRDMLRATLTDVACLPEELFDHDRLRTLLDEHVSRRRDHRALLLCLLTFGRWFRTYQPALD